LINCKKALGFAAWALIAGSVSCSTCRKPGEYKIALVPSRAGQHGVFLMNSDTTGGRLITPDATARLSTSSWSPDGSKIAFFTTRVSESQLVYKCKIPQHYPLYVINAGGGGEKRLLEFPVSDFEWSPDGRKLLFISACENPEREDRDVLRGTKKISSAIYVLDLRTDSRRRLSDFGIHCSGAWSPDNTRLALSLGGGESSDVYIADLKSGNTRRLTDSRDINKAPVWSPDGKTIAYLCFGSPGESEDAGVYLVGSDGFNKRRISDQAVYRVSWSPSGKQLLLQSVNGIYLSETEGDKVTDLVSGRGRPMDAVFSPDGGKVLFRSNHDGSWQLYSVNLDGTNLKRVTYLSASSFCISPLLSKP
jgi:TolB protein